MRVCAASAGGDRLGLLIRAHQARVPSHICGEDCSETTYSRHAPPGGKVRLTKSTLKPAAALD